MQETDMYEHASKQIGSYMLQGWILTDETCPRSSCHTPLLRSRDGQKKLCVIHDYTSPVNKQEEPKNERSSKETVAAPSNMSNVVDIESDDEVEQLVQRVKDNRQDKDSIAAKRREQSKRASELIGQKLLQQWALLNDICPNETCYAVPLVRDPQQRLYCVICEQTYMTEAAYNKQMQNQSSAGSSLTATAAKTSLSTPVTTQTISKDINLRDLDLDLDDPNFLETQLQMLRGDSEKQKQKDTAVTNMRQPSIGSNSDRRKELLQQMKEKVDELSLQAVTVRDPTALVKLFDAIKAGSEAIKAYEQIC